MSSSILSNLDWGTVPAWLGAGSLLLAFKIFLNDRTKSKRDQIEKVGIWTTVVRAASRVPEHPDLMQLDVRYLVKNASTLPVYLAGLHWRSEVFQRNSSSNYVVHHDHSQSRNLSWPTPIGPDETWTSPGYVRAIWIASLDREEEFPIALNLSVTRALLVDAAGRKWICYPGKSRARPVRWFNFSAKKEIRDDSSRDAWDSDEQRRSAKELIAEFVQGMSSQAKAAREGGQ